MKKTLLTFALAIAIAMTASAKENYLESYNLNRAYEEFNNENYAEALDYFDKELKEHPKNGYAHLGKAEIYFLMSSLDETLSSVDLALDLIPKKNKDKVAAARHLKGKALLDATDTVAGLAELSEAIRLNPRFEDAYIERGQVYYEQKQYDLSDADYRKIIEINPANRYGYLGLGRNQQVQGEHDRAIQLFDKAAAMYPDHAATFTYRATSYIAKKEYAKGLDDICRALAINSDGNAFNLLYDLPKEQIELAAAKLKAQSLKEPFTGEYYYYTGLLYAHHRMYDKSNEALKTGYDIESKGCFIQQQARNYQECGDYATAMDYVTQAQQTMPDSMDLIELKAEILGQSGDIDGSLAEWNKYIELSPDFFGGYYRRAFYKDLAMMTDEALEDYKMAVMLQGFRIYPHTHLGLADLLMRTGESAQAKAEYETVIETDSIPETESCGMFALLALGRKDEAIAYMDKVIEKDPDDAGAYYDAACLYCRMEDTETAMNHLKTALSKGFRQFYLIRHDNELEAVRQMPEFEEIMSKYESLVSPLKDSQEDSEADKNTILNERVEIPYTNDRGCVSVKCTINDLPLNFIFDTGASVVSMSQLEANFMLKNGYLQADDFVGQRQFIDANGDISEGTIINLRNVDFGGAHLSNVRASVIRNQKAPLLLGQSVLGRLGKIEIDNSNKKLIITNK